MKRLRTILLFLSIAMIMSLVIPGVKVSAEDGKNVTLSPPLGLSPSLVKVSAEDGKNVTGVCYIVSVKYSTSRIIKSHHLYYRSSKGDGFAYLILKCSGSSFE